MKQNKETFLSGKCFCNVGCKITFYCGLNAYIIQYRAPHHVSVLCEAATPGGTYVEGEVEQVHSAVRLLLATLDAHRGDPQAHQFSDQLMHITASFLHRSLLRVLSAGQSPGHQAAARTLTGYLDQVWRRKPTLAQDAAWYQQSSREWPQGQLTTQQRDSAQQWEQMNYQVSWQGVVSIDQSHKSHNAPVPYPTMHHFVTEMCTRVHISVTKWCIVGYLPDALWDLWDWSIEILS